MKNSKIINRVKDALYPILTFLALLVIWQVSVSKMNVPSYILPSPLDIVEEFKKDWPVLLMHSKVTLTETILGLSISVVIALLIGTLMDFIPIVKRCLYPIMYITQMIPTITIAPLLVIWFGFGIKSKVLCVILTCFFPILINFTDGIDSIDRDYLNLFKIMKANKIKTFIHLKFPMSLDKFFTGLKISSTYAFVAATVAEWLGGTAGLGVYMVRAKSSYALDKVFACTILVVAFSLIFVAIIALLKKVFLKKY
ncbi:ABC transporter permease [Peptostreptococcus russellii]|uniref:ABC transporter permease n=1 Tax=Peptostreptococcus russellii TaxID=215200 RepID=A0A2P7Q1N0_9FIRM|nr:ABC transporter permease [Peptostreptococcus russellii]